MWTALLSKAGEKLVELSVVGLVSAIGWGIYTSSELSGVKKSQAQEHVAVVTNASRLDINASRIDEVVSEQKVTNARLENIREILALLREDLRRSR